MKKLITSIALGIVLAGSSGCNSTPTQITIKAEGVIITSVNTGMQIWSDQVNAGHATQAQVDTVKTAYNAYYDAQMVAKAAIEQVLASGSTNTVDITTANAGVGNAEATLLSILNQFILTK